MYASYDERTYCMPVIMRGHIVRQLCERSGKERKILEKNFEFFHIFSGGGRVVVFFRWQFNLQRIQGICT